MDIAVLPDQFTEALNQVTTAIVKRGGSSQLVLQNVLLEAKEAQLWLTATNLELTIRIPIGARVDRPGAITLPGKILLEIAAQLPAQERIHITLDEATATATIAVREFEKRGKNITAVLGILAREFPSIPVVKDAKSFTVPSQLLRQALSQTLFVLGHNDARPALSGLYFQVAPGQVKIASSDGFRLCERILDVESVDEFVFILPEITCKKLLGMIGDDDQNIAFAVNPQEQLAAITIGRIEIFSQVIGSKYPDYARLIAHHVATSIEVYTNDLLKACKCTELFARDWEGQRILLVVTPPIGPSEPGQVKVIGKSAERGDCESWMDAPIEGAGLTIGCNVRYLIDVLTELLASERVTLEFESTHAPIFLRPVDDKVQYIAMIAAMAAVNAQS